MQMHSSPNAPLNTIPPRPMASVKAIPLQPASDHLAVESNLLTLDTLREVARLKPAQLRQTQLALEILQAEHPFYPSPDLDQVQVADIAAAQREQVTNVVRRLLAAQRLIGGHGTIMLIRGTAADGAAEGDDDCSRVEAIAYTGDRPGGLKRILLYSLDSMSWQVTHLSVYVLPKLHSHFVRGIRFETPALRYPLLPLTDAFDAKTRRRIAQKWTSDKLSDRLLAIQKLGQLMPALYFAVVDQFLHGTAVGTVDKAFHFAITVPATRFDQKTLVHLPFFRERQYT